MFENRKIDWATQRVEEKSGFFRCTRCGETLFSADKKFDSKTGFPSFWAHVGENVQQQQLQTYGRHRLQLLCRRCGQHLGHLFPDKRTPSLVRYCINRGAIELKPSEIKT